MRHFALIAALLSGCATPFKCGTHTLGDESFRESCGVMGSWGGISDEVVYLSLEPWGNDIYDEDEAEPRIRPAFVLAFHEGWLGDDQVLPSEAIRAACVDMGIAHTADVAEVTVLREASRTINDNDSWRIDWLVSCDSWGMSSEGGDVLSIGSGTSFQWYRDAFGKPPGPEDL